MFCIHLVVWNVSLCHSTKKCLLLYITLERFDSNTWHKMIYVLYMFSMCCFCCRFCGRSRFCYICGCYYLWMNIWLLYQKNTNEWSTVHVGRKFGYEKELNEIISVNQFTFLSLLSHDEIDHMILSHPIADLVGSKAEKHVFVLAVVKLFWDYPTKKFLWNMEVSLFLQKMKQYRPTSKKKVPEEFSIQNIRSHFEDALYKSFRINRLISVLYT